jgi:hypothetical protein
MVLRSAQPDDGWRVEVKEPGPEEVEVRFQGVDDSSGRGTRVVAVCATGLPAFRVDNGG